jgi:hypothetical protein
MPKTFKFYNNLVGWAAFAVALLTYTLTVEPTVSFWDCGEFLSASYKLEVGHPPGAPFFMLLVHFFSLFSPDKVHAAHFMNMISVFASAFTILFLFWTITHFAKKLISENGNLTTAQQIAVLGSGFIGAAAYTFSDSFWFSAVETIVFSASSFFTAIVFWAILKWEDAADEPYSNRWLIFIAYMMGLSIGVHLLNLLTIPALVFVYYFRKYKVSGKGILLTSLISVFILGFVLYGIIPGSVQLAAQFELMFVNGFGLPYHSGLIFYLFALTSILIFGIYYTHKKRKPLLNSIFLGISVMLLGYSSYAVTVIRATANTPMNENHPNNAFALLSYLNREQYGDRPLFYGSYYTADYVRDDQGNVVSKPLYTYIQQDGKYLKINKTNPEYDFDPTQKTLFPRMFSRDENHISAYQSWGGIAEGEKPNFFNNMSFFFKYQLGHMYFRYLMWNFSGRQNDEQGHGSFLKGNWISGIPFIDAAMVGPQSNLPDFIKNDKSRNRYFMLPFLLAFLGFFYSLRNNEKIFTIISLLFFFTGIAIVIYLNQTPYQPRERDYSYVGSFYAFSIWLGLGVLSLYQFFARKIPAKIAAVSALVLTIPIPTIMAAQNWDDHDRSGRYTARDFAADYLNSCEKNAILFTYGDNDTFPLWYEQEVEGVRTDVRVVNLSLLGTDWYINQMRRKVYDSDPLILNLKPEQYRQGKRDAEFITDDGISFVDEKYKDNETKYKTQYDSLYIQLISVLKDSKYATESKSEFDKIASRKHDLTPEQTDDLIQKISDKKIIEKFNFNPESIAKLKSASDKFIKTVSKGYLPLPVAMDFADSEEDYAKIGAGTDDEMSYVPSTNLSLSVDREKVLATGKFTDDEKSRFVSKLRWTIHKKYLLKNDWAVLEIIARNNWQRPIYFATSVETDDYSGLRDYFRLEGFAYRLVPYKTSEKDIIGSVNSDILYDNLMNQFHWGRMQEKDVLIESNNLRVISVMDIRNVFARCAEQLINENKKEKAVTVLDRCVEIMPDRQVPYDISILPVIENYYRAGADNKANELAQITFKRCSDGLKYYKTVYPDMLKFDTRERDYAAAVLKDLLRMAAQYKQTDLEKELTNQD